MTRFGSVHNLNKLLLLFLGYQNDRWRVAPHLTYHWLPKKKRPRRPQRLADYWLWCSAFFPTDITEVLYLMCEEELMQMFKETLQKTVLNTQTTAYKSKQEVRWGEEWKKDDRKQGMKVRKEKYKKERGERKTDRWLQFWKYHSKDVCKPEFVEYFTGTKSPSSLFYISLHLSLTGHVT